MRNRPSRPHVDETELKERRDKVLRRLKKIDPEALYREARLERCCALKGLRTCGRNVQHNLLGCGHAGLCGECIQRQRYCPVCGDEILKEGNSKSLRLYEECLHAGLGLPSQDEEYYKSDSILFFSVDARRLFTFFDIALEYDITSVIFNYLKETCLNLNGIWSDPMAALLVEGTAVIEWCYKVFQGLKKSLKEIYNLGVHEMAKESKVKTIKDIGRKLKDLIEVLSLVDYHAPAPPPESLNDLKRLIEAFKRTLQHSEAMSWMAKHKFLQEAPQRFSDITKWRSSFRQRKAVAQERAWQDYDPKIVKMGPKPLTSLFIEDCLTDMQAETRREEVTVDCGTELDMFSCKDSLQGGQSQDSDIFFYPALQAKLYPVESLPLFLESVFLDTSSRFLSEKTSVLLYSLLDRLWSNNAEEWSPIIDDYLAHFSISKEVFLETYVYFLLDEGTAASMEEISRIMEENPGISVQPKACRVLLESKKLKLALPLLRKFTEWGKIKGLLGFVEDAVTAVRVYVEADCVAEGFWFLRDFFETFEERMKASDLDEDERERQFEAVQGRLIGELCFSCIKLKTVGKIIKLPFSEVEEGFVENCLMKRTEELPYSGCGSLMVPYYIHRYRRVKAERIHEQLVEWEDAFLGQSGAADRVEIMTKMRKFRQILVNVQKEVQVEVARKWEEEQEKKIAQQKKEKKTKRKLNETVDDDFSLAGLPANSEFKLLQSLRPPESSAPASGSRTPDASYFTAQKHPKLSNPSVAQTTPHTQFLETPALFGTAMQSTPRSLLPETSALFGTASQAIIPESDLNPSADGFGSLLTKRKQPMSSAKARRAHGRNGLDPSSSTGPRALELEFESPSAANGEDNGQQLELSAAAEDNLEADGYGRKSPKQSPSGSPRSGERPCDDDKLFG